MISPKVWAEVTWGVLPSTACDVPGFQSRLHFSNPKPRRIGGITCPDPKSSYLSMFHSCKLELFPSWICQLTICLGTQLGVLHSFPQNTSALAVLCSLDGGPWVRTKFLWCCQSNLGHGFIESIGSSSISSVDELRRICEPWTLFCKLKVWAGLNWEPPPCLKFIDFIVISFSDLFISCIWVFHLSVCLGTMCVPVLSRGQERLSDSLDLE